MINWRSYFRNSSDPNSYAKDAKAIAVGSEESPFADLHTDSEETLSFEEAFKGEAIELWSNVLGDRFWLVVDEADAAKLAEPRGAVYTAAEARRVIQVGDPATVAEIHRWKRQFDAIVREYRPEGIPQLGSRLQNEPKKREGSAQVVRSLDNTQEKAAAARLRISSLDEPGPQQQRLREFGGHL